jgi:hypothetical protein
VTKKTKVEKKAKMGGLPSRFVCERREPEMPTEKIEFRLSCLKIGFRENELNRQKKRERERKKMIETTTSKRRRRSYSPSPSHNSLSNGYDEPEEKEGREESKKVSKTKATHKTVEENDEEGKLCLDERGRVHAAGNAKLEYASTSSVLFHAPPSKGQRQIRQNHDGFLEKLLRDCKKVFTAKQTLETESYSAGSTFWISAAEGEQEQEEQEQENADKRTKGNKLSLSGLERLALRVFEHVTKQLKEGEDYDSKASGAEWWTQVIDPRDDIGAHFDKDYYLEENMNISVHPQVGTVTYLSNIGAPTVVATRVVCQTYFDDSNPKCTNDVLINESNDTVLNTVSKFTDSVYLSWPKIGKITTFDGRCLHAAPSALSGFLEEEDDEESEEKDEDEDEDDDDDDHDHDYGNTIGSKRITFLVNVWLNHKPIFSEKLPEEVRETLEFEEADFVALFEKNGKAREGRKEDDGALDISTRRRTKLPFTHCGENLVYEYSAPEFCFESGAAADARRLGVSLIIPCAKGVLKRVI